MEEEATDSHEQTSDSREQETTDSRELNSDSADSDEEARPDSQIVPRAKRRHRRGKIGPRRKQGRIQQMKCIEAGPSESEGTTESSVCAHTTDSDVVELENVGCDVSFLEPHVCFDSEQFSDTTRPGTEDDESISSGQTPRVAKKKKKRKSTLSYKKKEEQTAEDVEEDIVVVDEVTCQDFQKENPMQSKDEGEASSSKNIIKDALITQNSPSSIEGVNQLVSKLKLLLSDQWIVSVTKDDSLRLICLDESENVRVKYSIYWKNYNIGIFVYNFEVPKSNKIFRKVANPELFNIGSVADYLKRLSDTILNSKICKGIHEHSELWKLRSGYVDSSSCERCYRSKECTLLLVDEEKSVSVCQECNSEVQNLTRQAKRIEKEKDKSKIPDKFLSHEDLKDKKDYYKKKYRSEQQRARRLQKKNDNLQIKLDEALQDDLLNVLKNGENLMTPLQKAFWESQRQALSVSDKRGLRWSPMMIRLGLYLQSIMPDSAYDSLSRSGFITLPSQRRLYDYSHFISPEQGCQEEITKNIKTKIEKSGSEDHLSYVNLMFDEMHLRAGLVIQRSTGELVGYTHLTDVEEDLRQLQDQLQDKTYKPKLAKKVLVYLAEGITSEVKDVIAVYSTDDLSSVELYNRTWEVIYHLEEAGIKVLTLTFDGAAVNRKFIRMHKSLDNSCNFIYCTKNLASGEGRPLYFIVDPPHLLKTVRNGVANSYAHKKSRKLWKNGENLSWKVIEKLYELTKENSFRNHKLSKAHVKLTSFSCMKVLPAAQVFSNSVAQCITDLTADGSLQGYDVSQLTQLILLMNRFFDCLNGKEKHSVTKPFNSDLRAYTEVNDERFTFLEQEFLGFFEQWKLDVMNRPGIYKQSDKNRMIISYQSLEALQITVKSFIGATRFMLSKAKAPKVYANVFNQDSLEQYFSTLRRKQGDNRNPTLKSVLDTRLNIHAQGQATASIKGNTLTEKRDLHFDSSPLPIRKRTKPP